MIVIQFLLIVKRGQTEGSIMIVHEDSALVIMKLVH